MVLVVCEFVRTRDPLICDLLTRDALNTYTHFKYNLLVANK